MHWHRILVIAAVLVSLNVLYTVAAIAVFHARRKAFGSGRVTRAEIARRKSMLASFLLCTVALRLPYRVRERYVLALHLFLNSFKTDLLLALKLFSNVLERVLSFGVYYLGFPASILFQRCGGRPGMYTDFPGEPSDVRRRY